MPLHILLCVFNVDSDCVSVGQDPQQAV